MVHDMRARIAVTAALTLIVGFLAASATGNRALGGVVLVLGGALCAWWMVRRSGWWRTIVVLAVAFALFVASHPLGDVIGAWPAVICVAAITGAVAWAFARER